MIPFNFPWHSCASRNQVWCDLEIPAYAGMQEKI